MLQKAIKFVKDNLAAVLGTAAIVIALLLMLLPGQFANLKPTAKEASEIFRLNGYEFFFNTKVIDGTTYYPGSLVTGAKLPGETTVLPVAIVVFALFILAIASFVFYKKSSSLLLLGGVLDVISSILFFAMEANAVNKYGLKFQEKDVNGYVTYYGVIQWTNYVIASLLVLAGAYAIYKSIKLLTAEAKSQTTARATSYSYLKK